MKRMIALGSFIAAALASSASVAGNAKFDGSVFAGPEELIKVQFDVPVGNDVYITLGTGHQLQFEAQTATESKVRLLDRSGKVLHESRYAGPVEKRPSVVYLICGTELTHMSPRPTKIPPCGDTVANVR